MARSFVRQGVNIVCSNMTVPSPRKLGLNPEKKGVEGRGITIYSKIPEPLLNISDKKLNDCFECKMPLKVWGGLTMFFAGIAVAAAVVIVVITAPVSLPLMAGISAATAATVVATATTVGTIATAGVVSAGLYTLYKTPHECDRIASAPWKNFHKSVKIEQENALLDASFMMCEVGGRLDIIIDDAIAQRAAEMIASANTSEVEWHWLSKFGNGILTFPGGVFGVSVASALEVYSTVMEKGVSNEKSTFGESAIDSGQDAAVSVEADILNALLKDKVANGHGGMHLFGFLLYAQSKGWLTSDQANEIFSRFIGYGEHINWKELLKESAGGLLFAVGGFLLDWYTDEKEQALEDGVEKDLKTINETDQANIHSSGNAIGIYAKTQ
ncbi:DUF4280 domain-containing protein [Salmonella enterica subsp. indica]|uniref:PAAR-like protein n=1 Tax=Salmonella enterica TaxID=28901 RepID=UPI0009AAAC83|nr:PAAR-like protein [Salmonella enterica]EBP3214566.1 DUF4280 domain-containing protein [Salmonella enterica subsp. arizonae]ECI8273399.1 DUF4280 domain-containing protein [Salmonella enterica subsp. enterica]EDR2773435.1 DUF4280 domain-containing protein [Salmonella enterica subsp. enterica serovar Oslo]EEC4250800.1 DUF4280 domain-containing protein [Salmonella enterica subsp. diarizonae]ECC3878706.1 DUF4280 domain-containing protein [Salmonella enterica subsp. indica]